VLIFLLPRYGLRIYTANPMLNFYVSPLLCLREYAMFILPCGNYLKYVMRTIQRSVAVIRPKSPFIKWANTCYAESFYDPDDSTVFLIPSLLSLDALPTTMGWRYINSAWDDIFKEMLQRWEETEWRWPQYRSRKTFGEWFKVEFHTLVIDGAVLE